MMEYVKVKSGADSARMLCRDWRQFVELQRADASPGEGWYPVEKVLPKPEPGAGQQLAFSYTVRDGVAYKEYFLWPAGRPLGPRVFSKFALEGKLFEEGLMDQVDAFIDSQTITNQHGQTMPLRRRYNTALEFSENHPDFDRVLKALKQLLGMTDEKVEEILAASVKDS